MKSWVFRGQRAHHRVPPARHELRSAFSGGRLSVFIREREGGTAILGRALASASQEVRP